MEKPANVECWGLECADLCKCSGSCNNETEIKDIQREMDDESDDKSKQSGVSDADSEEED